MFFKIAIKKILENVPLSIGHKFSFIPFELRLGKAYLKNRNEISEIKKYSPDHKKNMVFNRTKQIVEYAYHNISFYKQYYKINKFVPDKLKKFDDIKRIPIINKALLNKFELEQRSNKKRVLGLFNTGGTTGNPLSFYLESDFYSKEWAHMHSIWETLGFKHTDIRLTFRGKNIGNHLFKYNYVNNEIYINIYKTLTINDIQVIGKLVEKYEIKYFHGYPSAIYSFLKQVVDLNYELIFLFKHRIIGVFLGSEYPSPIYRDFIEHILEVKTISWYGHSEGVILASETTSFVYSPFLTYGFSEVAIIENTQHLIGTSYSNFASPFIRYDTGDIIDAMIEDDLLCSFKITQGREGEFITDAFGQKIPLTGLIFGRHHQLFNQVDFIQVKQRENGKATIFFVSKNIIYNPADLFDSSNISINFSYIQIDKPIISHSGKVTLLIC